MSQTPFSSFSVGVGVPTTNEIVSKSGAVARQTTILFVAVNMVRFWPTHGGEGERKERKIYVLRKLNMKNMKQIVAYLL